MGLDQWAGKFKREGEDLPQVDFGVPEEYVEIGRWRKHPNLHGWMEALYRIKGGEQASFNCTTVELTTLDLDALETAINSNQLPSTSGFFFGSSDGSEKNDDLDFVRRAREAIAEGFTVYYDSWW